MCCCLMQVSYCPCFFCSLSSFSFISRVFFSLNKFLASTNKSVGFCHILFVSKKKMVPYLLLILISGIFPLTVVYIALVRKRQNPEKSTTRKAPEPAGAWPIIGHLHLLARADQLIHHTLGEMADKYGSVFNVRLGSHRILVVADREAAKECFTTNDKILSSRPTTTATKHMCYNHAVFGFAPYSSHWREMRKIVMLEFLSNRRLDMLIRLLADEVDKRVKKIYGLWSDNNGLPLLVNLNQLFEDLFISVVAQLVVGKAAIVGDTRWYKQVIGRFLHFMGVFVVSDALPFLWWLDLQGRETAIKMTGKDLDAILGGWLQEHRRIRVSGQVKADSDQDFMDLMLTLEEKGQLSGFPYDSDTSIKSTCLALIAGGGETSSHTLSWAISLLLNNPPTLKKVQEELNLHVGDKRQVKEEDIKNLVYFKATVKETLRLYPVSPVTHRVAIEDCVVGGYHVPAGSRLAINIWKIQRDPKFWPNPQFSNQRDFSQAMRTLMLEDNISS
ncbi:hypothetical protein K2173_026727 [Erythroxylum novogranatense]|uniref:Cytochrome P450 n=1 Tax=Erythroxylum novogranatense TaxID=1862640 RepID=A0AAV8TX48_9ROSI|nr:hypothetical protein K2173_026727 [Erythroxylum novogranatense]